ncbi:MAG: hypothetical protein FJ384_02675 [Verrucomicrobia bacterium]|nr:hypothetical protein [Verrucomicrobiota bacterium]
MGFFDSLFGRRRDAFRGQADRDWRALVPQDVQRVPAGELGRKRVVRSKLPTVVAALFLGVLGALLWWAVDEATAAAPAARLRFQTDGFLSEAFVKKVIAAGPEGLARDVRSIKAELEADNQVVAADVRRRGDGTLEISLRERLAVAKIVSVPEKSAAMQVRLVAADGRTFAGVGYPEQAVRNLPEIQHFRATGTDDDLLIDGIEVAAPFLLTVRTSYPQLYKQWSAVSLRDCFGAQEDSPGSNLRVTVRPGSQPMDRPALAEIVFSTANWRNELTLLGRINVDELLRRPGTTASAYVLKMSIQNRTNAASPVPEPRLVPVTAPAALPLR